MKKNTRKIILGLAGLLISIISICFIGKKIDFNEAFELVKKVNFFVYFFLMFVYISTFFLRAARWKLMLRDVQNISYGDCLRGVVVGFAGNNFIPARGGEIFRMEFFSRETKLNRVTSLSSVFAEKVLDGLILVIILLISLGLNSQLLQTHWLQKLTITVTFLFFALLFVLIAIKIFGEKIIHFLNRKPSGIKTKIGALIEKIRQALLFLRLDFNSFNILCLSTLIWLIEGSVFVTGMWIFHLDINVILAGYFTLTIVNFGLLVPSSPAYIGVFQGMTIISLLLFNVSKEMALSVSILIHISQFVPITIWGLFIILKRSINYLKPA
jgi:uncharacterized protein (TIRG00374 family)